MNRSLIRILPLVVMIVLISATSVYAQSFVKADVPFAFKLGTAQLPAGTYEVKVEEQNTIMIRNGQTSAAAMSIARRESPRNTNPKLVFHRVGSQYFLAEIWRSAGTSGMIVPTSQQEKELEKELQLANNSVGGYEEVVVALN